MITVPSSRVAGMITAPSLQGHRIIIPGVFTPAILLSASVPLASTRQFAKYKILIADQLLSGTDPAWATQPPIGLCILYTGCTTLFTFNRLSQLCQVQSTHIRPKLLSGTDPAWANQPPISLCILCRLYDYYKLTDTTSSLNTSDLKSS